MTLGQMIELCGIQVRPEMSEGAKPQLSLVLPDLPLVKGSKNKETGEVPMVPQSLSLRAISSVSPYLSKTGKSEEYYQDVCETWAENTCPDLFKELVKKGETPLAFHRAISALVESMEEETESVSAADPNNIIAQFLAATLGKVVLVVDGVEQSAPEQIPTEENFRDVFEKKISEILSPDNIKEMVTLLNNKAEKNGRKDSGQISWRAPKKAKTAEPAAATA